MFFVLQFCTLSLIQIDENSVNKRQKHERANR